MPRPESPITVTVGSAASPCRRADAVRNREAILEAARGIVASRGADGLTMDAVAGEAGVGKGTLFRHFEGRAGLIHALMEFGERDFQERFLTGPPPLGPGAPAPERIRAFGAALIAHRRANLPLMMEIRSVAMDHPVYWAWHLHLRLLLDEAGAVTDAGIAAHLLLAGTDPSLLAKLSEDATDATWTDLEVAWIAMADGIVSGD